MGSELTDLQTYLRILLYTKSLTGTTASGANNLSVKSNMPDNTFENFWMFIFVSGQLVTEGSVWWGGGVAAQQRRRRNCQIFLERSLHCSLFYPLTTLRGNITDIFTTKYIFHHRRYHHHHHLETSPHCSLLSRST